MKLNAEIVKHNIEEGVTIGLMIVKPAKWFALS